MTVSFSSKLLLEKNIFGNKFHVNYCGVDHQIFKPTILNSFKLNGYELSRDKYLFHLSRYVPRKSPEFLFEIFKIIKNDPVFSKLKLVIGGKGWKEQVDLFKKTNKKLSSDLIYLGFVKKNDLKYIYSNALAFLFFSSYEGFGMPVVEAMSCKCISITNNDYSLSEIGLNETTFSVKNQKKEIVDLIKKIHNTRSFKEELKNKSFMKSLEFDWNYTARNTIKLLNDS